MKKSDGSNWITFGIAALFAAVGLVIYAYFYNAALDAPYIEGIPSTIQLPQEVLNLGLLANKMLLWIGAMALFNGGLFRGII